MNCTERLGIQQPAGKTTRFAGKSFMNRAHECPKLVHSDVLCRGRVCNLLDGRVARAAYFGPLLVANGQIKQLREGYRFYLLSPLYQMAN